MPLSYLAIFDAIWLAAMVNSDYPLITGLVSVLFIGLQAMFVSWLFPRCLDTINRCGNCGYDLTGSPTSSPCTSKPIETQKNGKPWA